MSSCFAIHLFRSQLKYIILSCNSVIEIFTSQSKMTSWSYAPAEPNPAKTHYQDTFKKSFCKALMGLQEIISYLPEVRKPVEKKVSFNVKLRWTLVIMGAFFILYNIPTLHGLSNNALERFRYLAVLFGTDFGSVKLRHRVDCYVIDYPASCS